MDNLEKLETLGTQDTGRRKTKKINVREYRIIDYSCIEINE